MPIYPIYVTAVGLATDVPILSDHGVKIDCLISIGTLVGMGVNLFQLHSVHNHLTSTPIKKNMSYMHQI